MNSTFKVYIHFFFHNTLEKLYNGTDHSVTLNKYLHPRSLFTEYGHEQVESLIDIEQTVVSND